MNADDLNRFLRPLKNKIYQLIGRGILTAINNAEKTQKVQFTVFDETWDGMERFQEYGLETYPDPGDPNNEIMYGAHGGSKEACIIFCVHNREQRPKTLIAGEVQLYTKFGQSVYLKADGSIVCTEPGGAVLTMTGGATTVTGKVNLKGLGGLAVMLKTIITKLNSHTHDYINPLAPSAVQPGVTSTMAAASTTGATSTLVDGVDSAADVKAAI